MVTRTNVFSVRLSEAERKIVEQAARLEPRTRSAFVRDLLVQASLRWLEAVEIQSRKSREVDRGP